MTFNKWFAKTKKFADRNELILLIEAHLGHVHRRTFKAWLHDGWAQQRPISVKALKWVGESVLRAEPMPGVTYTVIFNKHLRNGYSWEGQGGVRSMYESMEDAKDAAQNHFNARVLGVLK